MTTSTLAAITAKMRTVLLALTPGSMSDARFTRAPLEVLLREWAPGAGSAALRAFDVFRTGPREDQTVIDSSACLVSRQVTITIAYPTELGLYGEGYLSDLEDLVDADALQARDALFSPSALADGGHQANFPIVQALDRGTPECWFQVIDVRCLFFASQTLT